MATNFKSIPIIDIAPLLAKSDDPNMIQDPAVADVVRQLDRACHEAGFFYVKGHGIPDSMMTGIRQVSRQFFDLPHQEKLKIKLSSATGYRGYQEVGQNITKGVIDQVEAIDFYRETKPGRYGDIGKTMEGLNLWPSNLPNFKPLMEEYIELCTDLARKIMQGIALGVGGSPHQFEGNIAGESFWQMRPLGYPGLPIANGPCHKSENDNLFTFTSLFTMAYMPNGFNQIDSLFLISCLHLYNQPSNQPFIILYSGVHTDYGLLALLNQDEDITALQVRNLSGEWIWAPPIPGTFVCNIGDMLKILTNGLYESTVHRVINNTTKYRVCVGYFYETNFDAVIEPLQMCVEKAGPGGVLTKLGTADYAEHLVSRVKNNFRY